MTVSTPNWSAWTARETAAAWECVALSVAIEPRCLGLGHFLVLQSEADSPWLSDADPEWLAEMKQRLGVLREELKKPKSALRISESERILAQTPLKLDDFVRWARRKKWPLPEELKVAAKPASQPSPKAKPAKGKAAKQEASAGPEAKPAKGKAAKKKASAGPESKPTKGKAAKKKASAGAAPKPAKGKTAKKKASAELDASLGAESRLAHEWLIAALLRAQELAPEEAGTAAQVQRLVGDAGLSLSDSVIRKRLREIGGDDADEALKPRAAPGYRTIIVGLLHGLGLKPRSRNLLRKLKQQLPKDSPLPPDDIVKTICRSGS